jgi:peptidoglycan pentaglycine glycine transferase (the first glycine)
MDRAGWHGSISVRGSADTRSLEIDDAAWDAFVATSRTPTYLQTAAWASVKRLNGWGSTRIVAPSSSGIVGAQMLIARPRFVPWGVGYIPRGPISPDGLDRSTVEAFTQVLHVAASWHRLAYVRVEPDVEADASVAHDLIRAGWRPAHAAQPVQSRVVDLSVGERRLWGDLRPKSRQYIRHARRGGVEIVDGDRADLAEFFRILVATARRCGFRYRTFDAYEAVWDGFVASGSSTLLFARQGGELSATLFLVRCGDRLTEPYGGMTEAGARSRANYLLKWEAIRRAAESGLRSYDMWGLPTPGISQFKAGFGGRSVTYVGAWDLPTDRLGSSVLTGAEALHMRWIDWRHPRHPTTDVENTALDLRPAAHSQTP